MRSPPRSLTRAAISDATPAPPERVAVIDVGSASATLALYRRGPAAGTFELADEDTRDLGLMRLVGEEGTLGRAAVAVTVEAMREFAGRATLFGADRTVAIATSAVRDGANRDELVAAVREATGVELEVISGEEEARLAVSCALNTLPLADGHVLDLGGGSLQLARVRRRRPAYLATLPLGALRTRLAFLASDPPTGPELIALRRHADAALSALPWIGEAPGPLVGVGGTVRALAKIARRARSSPCGHLHGFALGEDDVLDAIDRLSRMTERERAEVPGLKARRAGTIVAGAVVTAAVLRATRAERILVSAWGIREACALEAFHGPDLVRDPRLAGLRAAFPREAARSARARARALQLFDQRRGRLDPAWRAGLGLAAWIVAGGTPAEALLAEPITGHTQDEVAAAAVLLGALPGTPPRAVGPLLRRATAS